ncbi:pentatricopeptide repeat-containing protein [Panicum miliaceum]|uniref:Pentatricopeptide repeat-containing protein n=1 Tax=Panicum miliaceum TaxID=4540 RepID=A0A3L6SQ37_PANMI|nr:pentatricopeptide repeat-containing protein [Panicum miliaceum]
MDPQHRSPEYNALLLAGPRLGPLRQAHARLVVAGHGSSLPLTTKLATLAVATGAASYAHLLAVSHPAPDSFLFGALTRAAAYRGLPAAALTFYRSLLTAALPFSSFAFTAVAKACVDLSALRVGMAVHAHAILFRVWLRSMHKNFNLGVEVAERLIALEPENPSHLVLLSNIYALSGKMNHVEKVIYKEIQNLHPFSQLGCRGAPGLALVCALVPGFLHRKLRASPLMRESVVSEGSDVLAVLLSSGGGWSGAEAEHVFE